MWECAHVVVLGVVCGGVRCGSVGCRGVGVWGVRCVCVELWECGVWVV